MLENILKTIINDWDIWRTEINQDGDQENSRMTKKQRKSKELFNVVVEDFIPSKENDISRKKVDGWIKEMQEDAEFNLSSYGECFVSENLLRKYVKEKNIPHSSKYSKQKLMLGRHKQKTQNRMPILTLIFEKMIQI